MTCSPSSVDVLVVGAGISGVACANALRSRGLTVQVVDRGNRPGGRLGERLVTGPAGAHPVDVGAAYFTCSDERFAGVVDGWQQRGLAHEWTRALQVMTADGGARSIEGPVRWAAGGGLRSLVDDLATDLDVCSQHTVRQITSRHGRLEVDGESVGTVVLAMPSPQAMRVLGGSGLSDLEQVPLSSDTWQPALSLWASWESRWWPELDMAKVEGSDVVAAIADDGRRRGDDLPVLVAHSTPEFAARHLEDPSQGLVPMLDELNRLLGNGSDAPEPAESGIRRWSFASPQRPAEGFGDAFHLGAGGLGLCGDGWGGKPRIEGAWLSGHQLGERIAATAR